MAAQAAVRSGTALLLPPVAMAIIVTLKKANKKTRMNIFHFRFMLFNLQVYGKVVTNLQIACVKS